MSQLVLARGNNAKRNILKRLFSKFSLGPYFLLISLIVSVSLITVITLTYSAQQVTKGYQMNYLEEVHQDLIRESEIKDMQISEVRSLNYIQNSSKVRSMRNPNQVVYIDGESAIASR